MYKKLIVLAAAAAVFGLAASPVAGAFPIDLRFLVGDEIKDFLHKYISQGNERSEEIERLQFDPDTKLISCKFTVHHKDRLTVKKNLFGRERVIVDTVVYDLTQTLDFTVDVKKRTATGKLSAGKLPGGEELVLDVDELLKISAVARYLKEKPKDDKKEEKPKDEKPQD